MDFSCGSMSGCLFRWWHHRDFAMWFLGELSGWGFLTQSHQHAVVCAGLHVKCPLLLPDFNQNWNLPTDFSKTPHYQISWLSVKWYKCFCVWIDRQTWWKHLEEMSRSTMKLASTIKEYVLSSKQIVIQHSCLKFKCICKLNYWNHQCGFQSHILHVSDTGKNGSTLWQCIICLQFLRNCVNHKRSILQHGYSICPMKLIRLVKMCLDKICRKVCFCFDSSPIHNLIQDVLLLPLFNFALEYYVRKVQEYLVGL
jgi:hypothetical protein